MPRTALALLTLLACPLAALALTPAGEKDETDVLREAHTFHIMFMSEVEARGAHSRLAGLKGADLRGRFEQIARSESKDTGSAPRGGDLGVVGEGTMVKSFEQALFAMAPGTVSQPVRSEFGWHLIYATDFKQTAVREICDRTLAESVAQSTGPARDALVASTLATPPAGRSELIQRILGKEWGQPLKDGQGNLAFLRAVGPTSALNTGAAVVHSEYSTALLSTFPLACRRSVRQDYEVDCSTGRASLVARTEFEGRAATGRQLAQLTPAPQDRPQASLGGMLQHQLMKAVCAPSGAR